VVDVYDAPGDCILRGMDNMQMRFASRPAAREDLRARQRLRGSAPARQVFAFRDSPLSCAAEAL
jgi:hypothetical protein